MNVCGGCRRVLDTQKGRFDWKLQRGYDIKDAAAFALYDPSGISSIKQCCIVNMQTAVDPDADFVERSNMKARVAEAEAAQREAAHLPPIRKEVVKLYCSNASRNVQGQFILEDAPFEDPTMLAPNIDDRFSGNRGTGFVITNIEPVPQRIINRENWKSAGPVICLWSGNIKIIPVIMTGTDRAPGLIWVQSPPDANGVHDPDRDTILKGLDKSFLQAEIISYDIETVSLASPFDPRYTIQMSQHVITLRKAFAADIIV